ncbi:MAG: glycerophosphodiester phosphodiesterase [Candidatus Saccharibacteria bacterium]
MKIIGHRGARGLAPENTIAALLKAIEHHVDEIECDIRLTKDHVAVLIHNPHLLDQAGHKLTIADHSYAELRDHKSDLARLDDAIRAVNRSVPIQFEIKPSVAVPPITAILKKYLANGWQAQDFLISSRSFRILKAAHAQLPDVPLVVIDRWSGVRATWRARRLGTKRLSMNQLWLWGGFVHSLAARGYELYPYTVNQPNRARQLAKDGSTGIITDFPDRFRD